MREIGRNREREDALARERRKWDDARQTLTQLEPVVERWNEEMSGRHDTLGDDPIQAKLTYAPGASDSDRSLPLALIVRGKPRLVVRLQLERRGTRLRLDFQDADGRTRLPRTYDRLEQVDGVLCLCKGPSADAISRLLDAIEEDVLAR
jgi:hypothetical protein